jgi:predicted nucleic acid-binding Zn ribbon protein
MWRSSAVPKRSESDPKPVGDLVQTLVAGRGWSEHMKFGRLVEEWATVVGADVAARSTPVALKAGILSIRADGAAWATELTLLGRSIVAKVDSYLGGGVVSEVRVTAGPPLR